MIIELDKDASRRPTQSFESGTRDNKPETLLFHRARSKLLEPVKACGQTSYTLPLLIVEWVYEAVAPLGVCGM